LTENVVAPPALTSPVPGNVLAGATVTFNWTRGIGLLEYRLLLGSTGVGSQDLYASAMTPGATETVSDLPTNGETIYARLEWLVHGVWVTADYTYIAQ